jgi:hypothetical protein
VKAKQLKTKIPKNKLPQRAHVDFLDSVVESGAELFLEISKELEKNIKSALKKESLMKSDIKRGWTGKVPKINIDVSEIVSSVIDRQISAMMYYLLGESAGKEAKEAFHELNLDINPGAAYGSYLHAIDTQRDYFKLLTGQESAPELPVNLMKGSFENIQSTSKRMIEESLNRYKNKLISAVDNAIQEKNKENADLMREKAHELIEDGLSPTKATKEAAKDIDTELSLSVIKDIKKVNEDYAKDWDRNVETISAMSSAAGTHQSMEELFGTSDNFMRAALVNIRDERCCDTCEHFARNHDGSLKIYKLQDFAPSASNFNKKKAEWKLSINPIHHRCRCTVVYVPRGFNISSDGALYKEVK